MLTEIFGMEWYKVHDEAEQLEHAVSADFERRLMQKLGDAAACPHGNRVGAETPQERRRRGLRPLDEARVRERVAVASVYERDRQLLERLNGLGIRPGAVVVVKRRDAVALSLETGGRHVELDLPAAGRIWVENYAVPPPAAAGAAPPPKDCKAR